MNINRLTFTRVMQAKRSGRNCGWGRPRKFASARTRSCVGVVEPSSARARRELELSEWRQRTSQNPTAGV